MRPNFLASRIIFIIKLSLLTFAKLKLQLKLIISPTVYNFVIKVEKNQIYTRQFYNAKMIPGIRKELKFDSRNPLNGILK